MLIVLSVTSICAAVCIALSLVICVALCVFGKEESRALSIFLGVIVVSLFVFVISMTAQLFLYLLSF